MKNLNIFYLVSNALSVNPVLRKLPALIATLKDVLGGCQRLYMSTYFSSLLCYAILIEKLLPHP